MGIKDLIRKIAWKAVGMDDIRTQLDSLNYYFKSWHDISRFPKAEGPLRDLQLADTELIAMIDKVLKKNDIRYWMSWGSLLGTVRHKGFIPWDDDIDIDIPRDDYERALKALREELEPYSVKVQENNSWDGIGYNHYETGVWADLYPVDFCTADADDPQAVEKLRKECAAYRKIFPKRCKGYDRGEILQLRKEMIPEICGESEAKSLLYSNETGEFWMAPLEEILPTAEAEFEDITVSVPNNSDAVLRRIYGNYTDYPRDGFPHHGRDGMGLADWAGKSGTDMQKVIGDLRAVREKI